MKIDILLQKTNYGVKYNTEMFLKSNQQHEYMTFRRLGMPFYPEHHFK